MSHPPPPPQQRVALAHDWLVGLRGGEWVLDRLAQLFGPTDLYTLVHNGQSLTDAIDRCNIVTSPLQRFPNAAGKWRRAYLPLMPWAVGQIDVRPCDLLISTSSAVMKSIIPLRGVPHVCYCHSPARYIWEQGDDYAHGSGGWGRALGLRLLKKRFQKWDRRTADRVTKFVANSKHTASRIQRCFDREAEVVYPPVRTNFFLPDPTVQREEWLLVVAALEPYKRTEIVVQAANRLNIPLKIVGDGSQMAALRDIAGPTVQMLGRISDQALRDLYCTANALVFPQTEDFGITAVEAQACGCPVIAFEGGGAREIVTASSGIFMNAQSVDAVIRALDQFSRTSIDSHACRTNALRFSEEAFDISMRRIANEVLRNDT